MRSAGTGGGRTGRSAPGEARIVPLKPGEPGPCVFLVPGTGGRVEGFAALGRLLRTPMPVYAIEARGVDDTSDPDSDAEVMIAHYLERIRSLQPSGPYFLAGHSFGGMVVHELAQRLLSDNEDVGCLILFDTVTPRKYWPLSFHAANLGSRLRGHVARLLTTPPGKSLSYYLRRFHLRIHGLHQIPSDLKFGNDAARMLLANEMLFKKWSPQFYPGRLILFCCADTKNLPSLWRNRVRELEVHLSAGSHLNLIEPPHVSSLAEAMSRCLARAPHPHPGPPAGRRRGLTAGGG